MALGSSSTTCPRISRSSPLAIYPLCHPQKPRRHNRWVWKREAGRPSGGGIVAGEEGIDPLQEIDRIRFLAEAMAFIWIKNEIVRLSGFLQRVVQPDRLGNGHRTVLFAVGDQDGDLDLGSMRKRRDNRHVLPLGTDA